MGTTRQKNSCRNRLQNGPHSLLRMKVGTHSPLPTGSHTAAYTAKHGPSGQGRYHYPRRIPHVHEHPRAGCQNGVFCRFWVLAEGTPEEHREPSEQRCAYARRGPAGLRDPVAVPLTALIGFTILLSRIVAHRKLSACSLVTAVRFLNRCSRRSMRETYPLERRSDCRF